MSIWEVIEFGSLYAIPSRNGLMRPRRVRGEGYKMVNMGEIFAYDRIDNPDMELVPMDEREKRVYSLKEGDLLFARQSMVEAGAGKCSVILSVPEITTFESHIIRVRLNKEIADPFFYYYYFLSSLGQGNIQTIVTGAAQKGIRGSDLKRLEVPYPDLQTQEEVANLVGRYDDLIANNERRISLLEEVMHLLYREWFVHLRFPRWEETVVIDGVPEGWEKTTVEKAFEIQGGGTPSTKQDKYWNDGEINWYTPSDLTKNEAMFAESSSRRINELGLSNSSAKLFPPYSVMMTSRATIGATAINTTEACTNQGFITCFPNKRLPVYFLYCWIKANVPIFLGVATGATFKEISKGKFRQIELTIPDAQIVQLFQETVEPIGKQILNLQRQNKKLKEARNALLPRLMSGRLQV